MITINKTSKIDRIIPNGRIYTFEEILVVAPKIFLEHFKKHTNLILSNEALSLVENCTKGIKNQIITIDNNRKAFIKMKNNNATISTSDNLKEGNFAKTQYIFYINGIRTGL